MSDINWAGLVQHSNPFADFAQGLQYGAEMRRDRIKADQQTARQKAYNLFATDPMGAEKALIAAGDTEGANDLRERRQGDDKNFRRGMIGMMVQKGDLQGAQAKAVQVGEFDLAENIGKLSADQRKVARENAQDLGGFAMGLLNVPYEQRKAVIGQARAILTQRGFTEQQIDAFDPSDANLQALGAQAMDLKTALEEANRQRDDNRAREQFDETKRHNRATEATSAGSLAVARGNLGVRQAEHAARLKGQGDYAAPAIPVDPNAVKWD